MNSPFFSSACVYCGEEMKLCSAAREVNVLVGGQSADLRLTPAPLLLLLLFSGWTPKKSPLPTCLFPPPAGQLPHEMIYSCAHILGRCPPFSSNPLLLAASKTGKNKNQSMRILFFFNICALRSNLQNLTEEPKRIWLRLSVAWLHVATRT